jgi:hypothetical protein
MKFQRGESSNASVMAPLILDNTPAPARKNQKKKTRDQRAKVQVNLKRKKTILGQYAQHKWDEKIKRNMRNALRA